MKILIIGTGYVGLVTGACFAEMGHDVLCLDIDKAKIAALKKGVLPFYEPGLKELVENNTRAGRLFFTTDYRQGVTSCTVCFIAVDTPPLPDGSANLKAVFAAAEGIVDHMESFRVIVNKSTVPVGTAHQMQRHLMAYQKKKGKQVPFALVSNPEFLQEGNALQTSLRPDRVVIGVEDPKAKEMMKEIYRPFMVSHERLLVMSRASAELTKYAANAMLASRISLMNELSLFCEELGADIHQVRLGIGTDARIGLPFLWAGIGYGGSCFPKDVKALEKQGESLNITTPLLSAISSVNHAQQDHFLQKILDFFSETGGLSGKRLGILGLSFKPGTDDLREAPSIRLIEQLLKRGAYCKAYDPIAMEKAQAIFPPSPQMAYVHSEEEAATGSDAMILCTEWKQFRSLSMPVLRKKMRGNAFFDGRNQYDPEAMRAWGFHYACVGRGISLHQEVPALYEERSRV